MIHRTSLRDVARYAVVGFAAVLLVAAPLTLLPRAMASDLVVNGTSLNEVEERHVRWIADNTYDRLQGSREDRLQTLATVTWWSLKEGVLDLENPHAYSNCLDGGKDTHYPPTRVCDHQIWQVGLSGVQVNNYGTAEVEALAVELYPGSTVDKVLSHTLDYAGYPPDSDEAKTVMNGGELLRRSWLLKNHGVGFALQLGTIERECVDGAESWCFGTGWDTSEWYAPTKDAAMGAIDDLRGILANLTAGNTEQPENPGPKGVKAKVWDTGGLGLNVRSTPDTNAKVVHWLDSGDSITISCQVEGPEVHNDVAGVTSKLWDYLPEYEGYVADAWVYTGTDGRIDGVPDCGDGTEPPQEPEDPGPSDPSECSGDAPAFPDGSAPGDVIAAMEERWGLDFQASDERSWENEQYLPLLEVWWNTLAKVECTPFVDAVNDKNGGSLPVVSVVHDGGIWGWYRGYPTGLEIDPDRQLAAVHNGIAETVEQNIIHELGHAYNNDRGNSPAPGYWSEYVGIYESDGGLSEYGRSSMTENFADVLGFYVARCALERFEVSEPRANPYDGGYASYYEFARKHVFDGVEFGPPPGSAASCG